MDASKTWSSCNVRQNTKLLLQDMRKHCHLHSMQQFAKDSNQHRRDCTCCMSWKKTSSSCGMRGFTCCRPSVSKASMKLRSATTASTRTCNNQQCPCFRHGLMTPTASQLQLGEDAACTIQCSVWCPDRLQPDCQCTQTQQSQTQRAAPMLQA